MNFRRAIVTVFSISFLGLTASAQTTQPVIDPAAQSLLAQIKNAYANLKTLSLGGTITFDADAGGEKSQRNAPFTAAFQSPNQFRQEVKEDSTLVSDGGKVIFFAADRNQFVSSDLTTVADRALPTNVAEVIRQQDPSLDLALAHDPVERLMQGTSEVKKIDDVTIGVEHFPALLFVRAQQDATLAIDSKTGLVRQARLDLKKLFLHQQVPQFDHAIFTIDYAQTLAGAAIAAGTFTFAPPPGASEVHTAAEAVDEDQKKEMDEVRKALIGKPAPPFKLEDASGKTVSLSDLKGNAVVLDFWATWCPPCQASLPRLNKLSHDQQAAGLKVFAINLRETPDKVKTFADDLKLSLAVLFDYNGAVAIAYHVDVIPQSVIIGKDGIVSEVLFPFDDEQSDLIDQAAAAALAAK